MEAKKLKIIQAPLKQKYKDHPQPALFTLKALANIGDGISCNIESGKTPVKAGLHTATGGDGLSACSGDMLLGALAACAGVTLRAVSTAIGVTLRDATITAEGDLDFRGTLAVDKSTPVGFQNIRLIFDLDTDATPEELSSLLKLTERYCVVYQTLINTHEISMGYSP